MATPNDTHVIKNESLTLGCNVTGFPRPTVRWEKNGQPLARFDNEEYHIRSANEEVDPGVYTCIAENYLGIARHSFLLQVYGNSKVENNELLVYEFCTSSSYNH